MSTQPCAADILSRATSCRDGSAAAHLKFISIFVIFFTSMFGMSSPVLLARLFQGKSLYDRAVALIKCFAAGVILSTSLVHVLPDAYASLADCRVATRHPWRDFPFSGLVTLLAVDLVASSHVEHAQYAPVKTNEKESSLGESRIELGGGGAVCHGGDNGGAVASEGSAAAVEEEALLRLKQKMVSQVLEIGIIFHSVIIGVTMGMSQNVCTIRPLVAALAFHQIFEGMGLGGCVAQFSRAK
ncbi:zinc transporter 6 [Stylosanthes scabra]|uniref:Zinc transporter 6 n=1 Tax=Stylosanthes scabra TaxID=79078 RepID=A0ABU6YRW0_9FABA|nr:zinc transporter 6 [Stylosanthes scabra]